MYVRQRTRRHRSEMARQMVMIVLVVLSSLLSIIIILVRFNTQRGSIVKWHMRLAENGLLVGISCGPTKFPSQEIPDSIESDFPRHSDRITEL